MTIRFISVNIERAKHLDLVLPFIEREKPDVLCLQEVLERDVSRFASLVGEHALFGGMTLLPGMDSPTGIALISRHPFTRSGAHYYRGVPGPIPVFDDTSASTKYASEHAMCLVADIGERDAMRIGTTHFTWTPDGRADDHQRRDLSALIPILQSQGELVFAGDFNAPRGGEIFSRLASLWQDNIPRSYEWSLDLSLHRMGERMRQEAENAGHTGFMVDGLFTTPGYSARDVRLVSGVSDHMAIAAHITKE